MSGRTLALIIIFSVVGIMTLIFIEAHHNDASREYNTSKELVYPVLHDDLKDCKFYSVTNAKWQNMYIVRCPNSVTTATFKNGKHTYHSTTISGNPEGRK